MLNRDPPLTERMLACWQVLDPVLKSKAAPIKGQPSSKRYVAFSARNKACPSPCIAPTSAPSSPRQLSLHAELAPAHSRAKAAGDSQHASSKLWATTKREAGREKGERHALHETSEKASESGARERRQAWMGRASGSGATAKQRRDESSSPPPLRAEHAHSSHGHRDASASPVNDRDEVVNDHDERSSAADAMLLIASMAYAQEAM